MSRCELTGLTKTIYVMFVGNTVQRFMFYENTHFASFLDWFDTMIAMDTGYL